MLEPYVGKLARNLLDNASPEPRRLQDVLLVDRGHVLASPTRDRKGDAGDALDLRRAIDHRIDCLVDAVNATLLFRSPVIDAAGELAQHEQIESAHDLRPQRRSAFQARKDAHGTQVSEQLVIPAQ